MNNALKILVILAVGFLGGLLLKDRIFGVGLPAPLTRITKPTKESPHLEMRMRGLSASKVESFVFMIEEPAKGDYLVFPTVGDKGVVRIEVLRK